MTDSTSKYSAAAYARAEAEKRAGAEKNKSRDQAAAAQATTVDETRYCYCNGIAHGDMVACDGEDCDMEWFHFNCVGLRAAPPEKDKWYCKYCKPQISKKSDD